MKKDSLMRMLLILPALLAAPAQANVFELRAVFPEQETVYLEGSGVDVAFQVQMRAMGSWNMETPYCDAVADFGDRSAARTVRLGDDGKPTARVTHRYTAVGEYTIQLSGASGRTPCEGKISGKLKVRPASERPAPSAAAPANAQAAAAAAAVPAIVLETRSVAGANVCPEGWFLVPGSMSGGRFTCHLQPVKPFNCPQSTQFFDTGNTVGCR